MSRIMQVLATTLIGVALLVAALVFRNGTPAAAPIGPQATQAAVVGAAVPPSSPEAIPAEDPLAPAKPPAELPGPCLNHSTVVDGIPPIIETVAKTSSDVVLGKVSSVGAAQWNTPAGDVPVDPDDYDAFHVFRLVEFSVDDAVKGGPKSTVVAWLPGGTIGCQGFFSEDIADPIKVGQRVALFLDGGAPDAAIAPGTLHGKQLWTIDSNDRVVTPEDGLVTVATFKDRVKNS